MVNKGKKEKMTTIKVSVATQTSLGLMKIHSRQSYNEVIVKLIMESKNEVALSEKHDE